MPLDDAAWARVRQLAYEETLTVEELIAINAWFVQHIEFIDPQPENRMKPWRDRGFVMGLSAGGKPMARFAARTLERMARDARAAAKWSGT